MTKFRTLTPDGLGSLVEFVSSTDSGETSLPMFLLDDARFSVPFADIEIPRRRFTSKLELATALNEIIPENVRSQLTGNVGAWTWLALHYLEQLAPLKDGRRSFGQTYRYILSNDYRHMYRHLVAGPYYIFRKHGVYSRIILNPEVSTHGDFAEQLGSRLDFITNAGVIQTADSLYFDPEGERPKRGATNRKKAGTLRRLITVLQQLDRTYDLYGMECYELLALLPREFDAWRPP